MSIIEEDIMMLTFYQAQNLILLVAAGVPKGLLVISPVLANNCLAWYAMYFAIAINKSRLYLDSVIS